jgi:HK97 family phage portal protein
MNLWQRLKNWLTGANRKQWPYWRSMSGGSTGSDSYGRKQPTVNDLVSAFNDHVYSCTMLIADRLGDAPIRLYVKTEQGQLRPKCETRPVHYKRLPLVQKRLGRATRVEEVVSHPALDLLNHSNTFHNWLELVQLTQLYMDVTGNTFWNVIRDGYGVPSEIYLLPTQTIEPVRDEQTGYIVGWKQDRLTQPEKVYGLDEIIHFKTPSLADPYGLGMSPVMAAWSRLQVGFKEMGYLDAVLTNQGRPDAVLSPEEQISPFESERLAKDFFQKFSGRFSGGIMVADGPMKLQPLGWPPRDLAEFQLYQSIKYAVSNSFGIPPDVWELGQSNRSSAEAVLYALAVHSIKPRLARIVEKLNERLIPMFDNSGRLFFEADSPIPEDKQFELQEAQMLLTTGTILRGEARTKYGYDDAEWANVPIIPPGAIADKSNLTPTIASLQTQVAAGTIDRDAAMANVQLTMNFDKGQAEALFPKVMNAVPNESHDGSQPMA